MKLIQSSFVGALRASAVTAAAAASMLAASASHAADPAYFNKYDGMRMSRDAAHFAGGIVPGDGIFTAWSYRVGPTRAEAMLFDPKPISAATAKEWGAVTEVVPDGRATARAFEIANAYLKKPEVTRRNTRIHFVQPLKLALIQQTGYGLSLEGASASALVKSFKPAR